MADVRPIARAIEAAGADAITRDQHPVGDRRRAGPPAAAPGQRLRRPVRPRDQAGCPADRVRGRPRSSTSRSSRSAGIASLGDVLDYLAVGAVAVQVGTVLFADPTLPVRLVDELAGECRRLGLDSYAPLIGTALPSRPSRPRPRASSTGREPSARPAARRPLRGTVDWADDHHSHAPSMPPPAAAIAARTEALFRQLGRPARGPLPAQERPPRRAVPGEVPGPPGHGRDERAVRLLGRCRAWPRRSADPPTWSPGRRPAG